MVFKIYTDDNNNMKNNLNLCVIAASLLYTNTVLHLFTKFYDFELYIRPVQKHCTGEEQKTSKVDDTDSSCM